VSDVLEDIARNLKDEYVPGVAQRAALLATAFSTLWRSVGELLSARRISFVCSLLASQFPQLTLKRFSLLSPLSVTTGTLAPGRATAGATDDRLRGSRRTTRRGAALCFRRDAEFGLLRVESWRGPVPPLAESATEGLPRTSLQILADLWRSNWRGLKGLVT